ncbi:MAG: phenylalanine--tRNA ligase subunit beta [Bryobacteraceae bacterium]|nr:phenylalanine--tRNA ligase subunit beta [Bryobacteraceae bacterium]
MKFSYNWLHELVEGLAEPPEELSRLITMKTAESEGVERLGAVLEAVSPARVLSVEPIAGGHNVKAVVETERYGVKTVVCGAPNCKPGLLTAYVPSGVTLDNGKAIRKAVIAGVESDGMLASGAELGVNRDHEGVVELVAGAALERLKPDAVIEIDNKSITHRPDLWGHHGMAREVAAFTGRPLREPVDLSRLPQGPPAIAVRIENFDLCPRYSALVFENVTVQPSPLWLQQRLEVIGLNPINNIVDVTNYVMAEIAQPMHAFDADRLKGGIIVRTARPKEFVHALNGETYECGETNLLIADEAGAVAIGGVIGGMESAISAPTTRIVLESANFNAASIRKTSAKLKLRTDASMRFEKAQDPHNTVRGLARAVQLLEVVSPGIRLVGGLADCHRELPAPPPIDLPLPWLYRKLGRTVPREEVVRILESLAFGVTEPEPALLRVTVPSWRATKDVSIKDDLVEEIGRMIGYASIPLQAPLVPAAVPPANPEREYHHAVREMAAAQGFTEVHNYSFLSEEAAAAFGWAPEEHVRVANPIASDQSLMRKSLLPGIRKNLLENARHFDEFRLFEIGREIHRRSGSLPEEVPHLAAAMFTRGDGQAQLFELKRLAECLLPGCDIRPAAAPLPWEHPARAYDVLGQGAAVGRLFEFHPVMIEGGRGAVLDLNLAETLSRRPAEARYQPLRRYPASDFDLSVIAPERALAGDIEKRLTELGGADLIAVRFVVKYSGPPLPAGAKSVSFRLTVGAPDRTLSNDDVTAIRTRMIEGMRAAGYELRA